MSIYSGPADWWTNSTDVGRTHIAQKGLAQGGVVLHLDAGVSSSYPGTGTAWTDLSGLSHNGTLVSSPTYSQTYLSFDGVSSRATFSFDNLQNYFYSQSFTLEAFARQTAASAIDGWLFDIDYVGYRLWGGANIPFMVRGPATSWETSTAYPFTVGSWYHVCATMIDNGTANNVKVYINGTLFSTHSFGLKNIGAYNNFNYGAISSHHSGSSPRPFDIGFVRKYTRVLSESEVIRNFNAIRGRYGI